MARLGEGRSMIRPGMPGTSRKEARLREWHRAFRREDGSVSLYMIVATAAMLLFTALLADYARIAAFNKQTELAAQSGVRSALSAYDEALYARYGLFGAGGSDRGELFAQAAERNWQPEDGNGFQLLRIRREASHVDAYEVLGNQTVFTRQVLEEMKYKAPIDFTMEIASRFAPMGSALKEASATVGALEDVKKLYEERERHLERVEEIRRDGAGRLPGLASKLDAASGIVEDYGSYENWLREDAAIGENEQPKHAAAIGAYRVRALNDAAAMAAASSSELERLMIGLAQALTELQSAERLNASIAEAAKRMEEAQDGGGFDQLAGTQIGGQTASSMTPDELAGFGDTRKSIGGLTMEADWFERYRKELNGQLEAFQGLDAAAAGFDAAVRSALAAPGGGALLDQAWASVSRAVQDYDRLYGDSGTALQARREELRRRHAGDEERKSNEAAAQSKWGQVKAMIGGLSAEPGSEEQRQAFEDAKRLAAENLTFNQAAESGDASNGEPSGSGAGDSGDAAKSALSSMGAMFGGMGDLLQGIRDPLYVNEYIAHRFSRFDPEQLREVFAGGSRDAFAQSLALENQETEFILYGFGEPGANIAAAYGEIFAARLAIRTMEGLIASRALVNPLLILSAAVLYGVEKSIADMTALTETGKVQLSKYVPVELTYADYLRLFLLLHGSGGQARTARVIAVIEHNTGVDLSNVATGLSGELTSSVNLWFLPGLMRSFTATGILSGKVKDGRYEKTQTIGSSYG
ncbi:hypothetical protein [Paenibacillus sp. GCM10023250]|uniref:hypothetical protein n=1 Tax=Paenibacillus sp. GCM10023250 TaxID=3252648 RepID=UPI0036111DFB